MIKVAIVDDHRLFREGVRLMLGAMPDIALTVEASTGHDLFDQLVEATVDVMLLDIEMKDMHGKEVLQKLRDEFSSVPVVILSMYNEPRIIRHFMELGASAYLQKDVHRDELETAIRTVYSTGVYLNPETSQSLLLTLKKKADLFPETILSRREREVLMLICAELTTLEIAEKLCISERTVEGHRRNLCLKLDARNTAGLVRKAIAKNLVPAL